MSQILAPPSLATAAPENRPLTSIRGIAALGVFITHVGVAFWPFLPRPMAIAMLCGWMGVDLFFVLSGFILITVYETLQPQKWGRFWAKRVVRLFPLNTFILCVLAALALAGYQTGTRIDWPNLPLHFFMLQSFVPGHKPGWIFNTWSVGVELICYLVFPWLVMRMRTLSRTALIEATLLIAALTWHIQIHVLASFWGMDAVMRGGSEFLLGCAVGLLARRLPQLPPRPATALECVALACLIFGVTGGFGHDWCVAPGSWRMASVPLSAALLILALSNDSGRIARLLRIKPLYWLGQISFSLYLLHGPMIERNASYAWVMAGGATPRVRIILLWAACVLAATLVMSALTYRFVEEPARKLIK